MSYKLCINQKLYKLLVVCERGVGGAGVACSFKNKTLFLPFENITLNLFLEYQIRFRHVFLKIFRIQV